MLRRLCRPAVLCCAKGVRQIGAYSMFLIENAPSYKGTPALKAGKELAKKYKNLPKPQLMALKKRAAEYKRVPKPHRQKPKFNGPAQFVKSAFKKYKRDKKFMSLPPGKKFKYVFATYKKVKKTGEIDL